MKKTVTAAARDPRRTGLMTKYQNGQMVRIRARWSTPTRDTPAAGRRSKCFPTSKFAVTADE